jgi:MATE family multidrug resistance protein
VDPRRATTSSDAADETAATVDDRPSAPPPPLRPRHDILTGDIRSAVTWLALPVLGEQVLNAMVAWNDTFLAGRIDAVATAAVGFGAYMSWLVSMLFSLAGIGATAIVARYIGAGQPRKANHACNQSIILAAGLGFAGTILVFFFVPYLVRALGLSDAAAPIAIAYIRIDAIVYVAEAVTLVGAACLRGAGNTRTPMLVIGFLNIVNLPLSWVLTFGLGPLPGIGVNGIAWGTVGARIIGGVLMAVVLLRGDHHLQIVRRLLKLRWTWTRRILRIGLPASIDGLLLWTGHFIFMSILTKAPGAYTADVLYAAHIVGIRIESLSYLPAFAWSLAASTLVGQNLGAGQPERALACAHEARKQAVLLLLFTGVAFFFGADVFFRFLSNDPDVVACGTPALKALAFFQPFVATVIVYIGALRGAGDTLVPMIFTVIGMMLLRLPVAYLGAIVLQGGLLGAWCGMFVDLVARALMLTWRVRAGAWRHTRV